MLEPKINLDIEAVTKLKDENPIKEGDLVTVINQETNTKVKAKAINVRPTGFDLLVTE